MRTIKFLAVWLRRIPVRFTVVFLAFFLASMALVSWVVAIGGVDSVGDLLWRLVGAPPGVRETPALVLVAVLWEALVVILLVVTGVLLAYNLSVPVYRLVRRRPRVEVVGPGQPEPGVGKRLADHERIGIILAGGGAKGAFQAGALRAIYEFLEANDALHKVKMIAGTSIGSWNAMFWLAGLVKPSSPDGSSLHEIWWRSIGVDRIIEFAHYLPFSRNYFLTPRPWRESFRQIFIENDEVRQRMATLFSGADGGGRPPIHFYFTRSNVALGRLEFSTNRPDLPQLHREHLGPQGDFAEPVVDPEDYEIIAGGDLDDSLERTGRAVFASMDLPPLFPYARIRVDMDEWFEDGGVVDNVPIRFGTQLENCDLLFVVALNASFTEDVDQTSIVRRLFRVMDVRQGVLERNSFKMVYLYNELASLRGRALELGREGEPSARPGTADERAMRRKHRPVAVFSVCPDPPLVIDTVEFWNRDGAARAFDVMYAATKYELESNFERDCDPEWIRMTLVNAHGERRYLENF